MTPDTRDANQQHVTQIITALQRLRTASIKTRDALSKNGTVERKTETAFVEAVRAFLAAHKEIGESDTPFNRPLEEYWNLLSITAPAVMQELFYKSYENLDVEGLCEFVHRVERYTRSYYHDLGYRLPQAW